MHDLVRHKDCLCHLVTHEYRFTTQEDRNYISNVVYQNHDDSNENQRNHCSIFILRCIVAETRLSLLFLMLDYGDKHHCQDEQNVANNKLDIVFLTWNKLGLQKLYCWVASLAFVYKFRSPFFSFLFIN